MEFKSLTLHFEDMSEVKLNGKDIETLMFTGISDEIVVTGHPQATSAVKTCDTFQVQIKPSANVPGRSVENSDKKLFDVLDDHGDVIDVTVAYDDGTETSIRLPYDGDESNRYQRNRRLHAGFFITVDRNRRPETNTTTAPVKITVTPCYDAMDGDLRTYRIKIFFPALNYTHEETFIGTNAADARTAANFIARAVAMELKASLDAVIGTTC